MLADPENLGLSGFVTSTSSTAPGLSDVTAANLLPPEANSSTSRAHPRLLPSSWIVAAGFGLLGSVKSTTWTAADPLAATSAYALPPDSNALTLVGAVSVTVPSSSSTAATATGGTSSEKVGADAERAVTSTDENADGFPIPSTALAETLLLPSPSSTWMNHAPVAP